MVRDVAASTEAGAPADPITALARILYERMERLAPGPSQFVEWDKLTDWYRGLYTNSIRTLLEEPELIHAALHLADDDVVLGRDKKAE